MVHRVLRREEIERRMQNGELHAEENNSVEENNRTVHANTDHIAAAMCARGRRVHGGNSPRYEERRAARGATARHAPFWSDHAAGVVLRALHELPYG